MNNAMNRLDDMLYAFGDCGPTRTQSDRIISWIVKNIDSDMWMRAADMAELAGCGEMYTELSMRAGEGC